MEGLVVAKPSTRGVLSTPHASGVQPTRAKAFRDTAFTATESTGGPGAV
jgi:hypothetical protein